MGKIFNIDGHTIEFGSGSGSLNPWSSQYCREIGLSLMCTSDIVSYIMIDGEKIYKCRRETRELLNAILDGSLTKWDEIDFFFPRVFENFVCNFSENKKSLDEMKRRNDEFNKLSPEEKKERIAQCRAERKAEIERKKQQ